MSKDEREALNSNCAKPQHLKTIDPEKPRHSHSPSLSSDYVTQFNKGSTAALPL